MLGRAPRAPGPRRARRRRGHPARGPLRPRARPRERPAARASGPRSSCASRSAPSCSSTCCVDARAAVTDETRIARRRRRRRAPSSASSARPRGPGRGRRPVRARAARCARRRRRSTWRVDAERLHLFDPDTRPGDPGLTAPCATVPFPDGFLWGVGHVGVPDRGRGGPRRSGAVDLGHVRARRRARSAAATTPAVAADHRGRMAEDVALLADLGVRRLPVLDRLAPGAADRRRARQRARASTSTARLVDAAPGRRHRARRHAVPLGPARRPWRTPAAGPSVRHRRALRRLRRAGRSRPRRPRAALVHDQRAVVLGDARLRRAASTRRAARSPAAAVAAAHHLLLGHGLAVDALRAARARSPRWRSRVNPYPVVAAGPRRRRPRRRPPRRRHRQPPLVRPGPAAVATPTTSSRTSRR